MLQDETNSKLPTEHHSESINHILGEIQVKSEIAPTNNRTSSRLPTGFHSESINHIPGEIQVKSEIAPTNDGTSSRLPTESHSESINDIPGEIQVKSEIAPTNDETSSRLPTEVHHTSPKCETQTPTAASLLEHLNKVSAPVYTTEKVTNGNESSYLQQIARLSRDKRHTRSRVEQNESLPKENQEPPFAVDHTAENRNQTVQTLQQKATPEKRKSGKLKNRNKRALCTLCNKTFGRGYLHRHKKRVHMGIYNYKYNCEDCELRFMARFKYLEHRRRYHTFEKPYQCDICNARFCGRAGVRYHMVTHTGNKPVTCKRCGRLFALNNNLKIHLRECKANRNARVVPLVSVDHTKSVHTSEGVSNLENSLMKDKRKCGNGWIAQQNSKNCTSSTSLSLDRSAMSRSSGNKQQTSSLTQKGESFSEGQHDISFVGNDNAENGIAQFLQYKVTDGKPTCTICNKTFSCWNYLPKHKKRVHLRIYNHKYNCEVCGERFLAKHKYVEHCRRVHAFEKPYQCDICSKRFVGQYVLRCHIMRNHTGVKPFTCRKCGQLFAREDNRNSHQSDCKNKGIPREISHTFASLGHSNRVENSDWNAEDKSKKCAPLESVPSAAQGVEVNVTTDSRDSSLQRLHMVPLQSSIQNQNFESVNQDSGNIAIQSIPEECKMRQSLWQITKLKSGNAPFTVNNAATTCKKRRVRRAINLRCKTCNVVFESRALLIQHKVVHNVKQFQCDVCSVVLTSAAGFRRHKKHVHDRDYDRKYICDFCGKRFYVRRACLSHIRQCHTGEKPYLCHLCEKSFATQASLRAHLITHSEQRPYKCTLCDKGFAYSHSLKMHLLSHSGEASYPCPSCGRRFPTEYALKLHKKTFKIPQSCNNCTKLFCTESSLQRHLKICQPVTPKLVQANGVLNSSKARVLLLEKENVRSTMEESFQEKGANVMCEQNNVEVQNDGSHFKIENQKAQAVKENGQVQVKMDIGQDQVNKHLLSNGQAQESQFVCAQYNTKPLNCKNCGKTFASIHTFSRHQSSRTCSALLKVMDNEAQNVDQRWYSLQQKKNGRETQEKVSDFIGNKSSPFGQSSMTSRGPQPEGEMQIICDLCGKIYSSKSSLYHHRNQVHLKIFKLKHVCKFCGKRFYKIVSYRNHINIHTGERPYECDICMRKFTSKNGLRKHMFIHQNLRVECTICNKSYSNKYCYRIHLQLVHLGGRIFTCNICQKTTKNKISLRIHMRSHTEDKKEFQCERCSKRFTYSKSRENHVNNTCPVGGCYICQDCMKPCGSKSMLLWHVEQIHKEPMLERQFACTICNKRFTKRFSLADHILTHGNEKPFQCSHCPKAFFIRRALKVHMISHQKQKHFTCSGCSKEFKYSSSLSLHRRKYCHASGTYMCRDCPSKFATKEALTSHFDREHVSTFFIQKALKVQMISHPKQKRFTCSGCSKEFKYSCSLSLHQRKYCHASGTYTCRDCPSKFATKEALISHFDRKHISHGNGTPKKKVPRPTEKLYKCDICLKSFAYKHVLETHMNCHAGKQLKYKKKVPRPTEKLYKCDVCLKSFAYKQVLETHMNCHAGKQFKCENCSKPFTYKNSLYLHMKKYCRSKLL